MNKIIPTLIPVIIIISQLQACNSSDKDSKKPEKDSKTEIFSKQVPKKGELTHACIEGNLKKVKKLVRSGANVNEQISTRNGYINPLLVAAINGHIEIIRYLIIENAAFEDSYYLGYKAHEYYQHGGFDSQAPWPELYTLHQEKSK